MKEDEFDDSEGNRTKKKKFYEREEFIRQLDNRAAVSGILKHSERLSPQREDGCIETINIQHQHLLDCGCLDQEPGAICCITGQIYCVRCVLRLKSFCAICGGFVTPEHYFQGPGEKGYCRNHRFHWRRLITG